MKKRQLLITIITTVLCIAIINVIIFFMLSNQENSSNEHIAQKYYDKIYNESELDGHELVAKHEQFEVTKFDLRFKKYTQQLLAESGFPVEELTNEAALDEIVKQKLVQLEVESLDLVTLDEWYSQIQVLRTNLANEQADNESSAQTELKAWAESANLTIDELLDSQYFQDHMKSGWNTIKLEEYLYAEGIIQRELTAMNVEEQPQQLDSNELSITFDAYVDELLQTQKANIEIIDLNI